MPNREEKLESGALLVGACVTGVSLKQALVSMLLLISAVKGIILFQEHRSVESVHATIFLVAR